MHDRVIARRRDRPRVLASVDALDAGDRRAVVALR
jgi:hypothetical protein